MPRTWRLLRPSVSSIQRCGGSHHETSSKRMIEQVGSTGQAMCQLHVASEVLISAVWGPSLLFMHTCVHGYTCVHIYHTCTHVPLLTIRHCMIADAYCASPYSKDPCNISSRSRNRQIIWASQAMQIFPFSNGIAELRFAFRFRFRFRRPSGRYRRVCKLEPGVKIISILRMHHSFIWCMNLFGKHTRKHFWRFLVGHSHFWRFLVRHSHFWRVLAGHVVRHTVNLI